MLIVRSPVRISFGGGGTDFPSYFEQHEGAVLSCAINKYFYTFAGKRDDGNIQVISSDLRVMETWRDIEHLRPDGSDLEIPLAVIKEMRRDLSIDLFLASEIPPGTGLGSSASVCVNILKTLSTYLRVPLSKYELAERAFHIAAHVLGRPVGKQDEYAAAFGGMNFIIFHRDGRTTVEPIEMEKNDAGRLQQNLMLFFTGVTHHSWTILKDQEKSTREKRVRTVDSLHQIRLLAGKMRTALVQGDLSEFGRLLDESWQEKKKVSDMISNPRSDELYSLALANGALGGKITGAGGGGFLLLYCEAEHQDKVREAFAAKGIREMHFGIDAEGARVLVNDPFIDGDENGGSMWTFVPTAKRSISVEAKAESPVRLQRL